MSETTRERLNVSTKRQRRIVPIMSIMFGALILFAVGWAAYSSASPTDVTLTEFRSQLQRGDIERLVFEGEHVMAKTTDGVLHRAVIGDSALRAGIVDAAMAQGIAVEYTPTTMQPATRNLAIVGALLVLLAAGILVARRAGARGTAHFEVRDAESEKGFDDVAGLTEPKRALSETVAFLRAPERFAKLGGRPPRGLLLTGEPGTGKTMLARAAAREAGVPFLTCSGGSFQEMFVGVGAARVRKLFAEARKLAPCVVFIDEIDAIGKKRGASAESASGEHDQTLNQLLVELDGFDVMQGIVVIATTNRADILDSALVRPGRFDRQIYVSLPSQQEREAIIAVHAKGKPLATDVDLGALARSTGGLSGAELANILNEAAMMAARTDSDAIEAAHLDEAIDRVLMGAARPGVLTDPEERRITAIHEAGHVAVAMTAPTCDRVHKVSILPRDRSLGVTMALPDRDRLMSTREHLEDRICMLLGGRAAEVELLATSTAGAADDIQRATEIARTMVTDLGMSELGCLQLDSSGGSAQAIENETRRLMEAQLDRARSIVRSRRAEIEALVEELIARDTVERAAIEAVLPRARDVVPRAA